MNWRKRPVDNAPFVCAGSAYLDAKAFEIPDLTSKSDKAYHAWVGNNYVKKYPVLKDGYSSLRECVERYHPEVKKF